MVAERQVGLDDAVGAWESALEAAKHAEPIGWDRYWDGGSRRRAYELLVRIDPVRGRRMALGLSLSLLNFAGSGLPVPAPSRLFYATSATASSDGASASKAPTR